MPGKARLLQLTVGEFRVSALRTLPLIVRGKPVFVGRRVRVRGVKNISLRPRRDVLTVGLEAYEFIDHRAGGLMRVRGHLCIDGHVAIAGGNRWDIGPDAAVHVGNNTFFSPDCLVVIRDGLRVGQGCAIGWAVQLLDDDLHVIVGSKHYPRTSAPIVVGNHVWIGSHAKIFKGVTIADDCMIAGGAVVTRSVHDTHCLIAGNPARVVRRDFHWK